VELICGCMFSGKSGMLISRITAARSRGLPVAAFKHASDDRYARTRIATHDGRSCEALPVERSDRIPGLAGGADLVVIDEAQFFDAGLPEVCRALAEGGADVVLAGLDLDAWGLPFGPMPALEAIADRITRLHAVCAACGAPADRTQRIAPVESPSMIGGSEAYEPRCANCFRAPPAHLRR